MSHRADTPSTAAENVRAACLNAAIRAYEDAGIRGLCADGRWEAAIAAIRQLNLSRALEPPTDSVAPTTASTVDGTTDEAVRVVAPHERR